MLDSFRIYNNFSWKQLINRSIATNAVYFMSFSYLLTFNIFNSLYCDSPQRPLPDYSDVKNVTIKPVACWFSVSGYYERTPRYICYVLLVFTVVIRNHKWLAIGAATSVLTYSGVAAIHLIVLFATNNRLDLPKAKSYCEYLPIPGTSTPFAACTGVWDPDVSLSMSIVSIVILGALPMVVWSTTFKTSKSKAILLFWLLLLAVAHTFFPLTETNSNPSFQICPKDYTEPFPMTNYQAPFLDQSWRDSFSSLVSTPQQSSEKSGSGSWPACIYSCFATPGYLGRNTQDIIVWDGAGAQSPIIKSSVSSRSGCILFWWVYTLLAVVVFFTTKKKEWLPKWFYKLLFSVEYRQQPLLSRWKCKKITTFTIKRAEKSITAESSKTTTSVKIHITVLQVVQLLTQLISIGTFCGNILNQETQNAYTWSVLSQEPFAAIGQWGNLVVVLLVLVAAGISRIWAVTEAGDTVIDGHRELEEGIEDWNSRIGYAS